MTREEAIIILTNMAFLLRDGTRYMKLEHEKQFREAYEMAIKALEQPEIIRCRACKHHILHKRLNVPWCRLLHIDMGDNQFCSCAERREDE